MHVTIKEIEHLLYLYPIAKKKHLENLSIIKQDVYTLKSVINKSKEEDILYSEIVKKVEIYLSFLSEDEYNLIKMRYFENYNYEQISIKANYSNHSSVLKKK